ncbi:MAG: hypothetical protein M0P30_05445 [Syntrophorhabdaceae bacterium]|nr:hypothetical protein [Syntrophorhabdaceae bacterium]
MDRDITDIFEEASVKSSYGGGGSSSDWDYNFDDWDSSDWEGYSASYEPEDEMYDDPYEYDGDEDDFENEDESLDEPEPDDNGGVFYNNIESGTERQQKIIEWLASSELAKPLRKASGGFFVRKGELVRLLDGKIVELMVWLSEEGIKDNIFIMDYLVKRSKNKTEDAIPDVLFFEKKTVVDAPFRSEPTENDEFEFTCEDDIHWF